MNTEQTDHTQTPEDRKVRLEFRVAEYVEDRTRNKEPPYDKRFDCLYLPTTCKQVKMDYNNDLLKECYLILKIGYGIELKWSEKAALKNYLESWSSKIGDDELIDFREEGINSFMREYFDIETTEMGLRDFYLIFPDRKADIDSVGSGWTGTSEFKAYCQDRIQMWRDERELI